MPSVTPAAPGDDRSDDSVDERLARSAAAVEDFLLGLRDAIARMAGDTAARLDPTRDPVPADLVAAVEPSAADVLADDRVLGAGFVADPDAFSGTSLLAWWQGERRVRVAQPVSLGRDADYRSKEWFRTPLRAGGLHVTGPYLDYVCSDEFVLTLTLPLEDRRGVVLGLAGADVLAETLEQVLGPALAPGAVLVNRHDQVVVAGGGRWFAGDRVDRRAYDRSRACRDLPLTVLSSSRTAGRA